MEEKRIIVLVEGTKEDYESGRAICCTTVWVHEVDCAWFERKHEAPNAYKYLITIYTRNEKRGAIAIKNEKQAAAAYSSILNFLVGSEKILHVFSK